MFALIAFASLLRAEEREGARVAFRIPSQPLDQALLMLAHQARMQLVAVGDLDGAARGSEIAGIMPVRTALQRLLAGTGYEFELRDDGVITVSETHRRATKTVIKSQASKQATENLATVVVSARRRDERWIDVPMAVSVIQGTDIERLGLSNVADALNLMSSVTSIDSGAAFTQVQVRGVSSSLGGNDNGYYIDDAPFSGVSVPWHPDMRGFDLDRVEVLKGPQGTLFGEGSMGGTVRIFTRAPELDELAAIVRAGVMATEGGGVGGSGKLMFNAPLVTDQLALRAVVTRETLPGWVDVANGGRDINAQHIDTQRARLRWSPNDRWVTDATFLQMSTDANGGDYSANDDLLSVGWLTSHDRQRARILSSQYELAASRIALLRSEAELEASKIGQVTPTFHLRGYIEIDVDNTELRWSSTGASEWSWLIGYAHRDASRRDDIQRIG